MTYGYEAWSLTTNLLSYLWTTQRAMERFMLGISLNDKKGTGGSGWRQRSTMWQLRYVPWNGDRQDMLLVCGAREYKNGDRGTEREVGDTQKQDGETI